MSYSDVWYIKDGYHSGFYVAVLLHANDVKNVLPYFIMMVSELNRTDVILVLSHMNKRYEYIL